ncbi:MAG: AAA family ATPase [Desulfovibrionaceae bacterium]|nr:AAA family ATPase [Desulfovibrionaceae bacterium]
MQSHTKFLTLFNNKGGVGKTSLVYHLAWMFRQRGISVLAADLDPQCNLTSAFLTDEQTDALPDGSTIYEAISPLLNGVGDVVVPPPIKIRRGLNLVPGDLSLSLAEDEFSLSWARAGNGGERDFRVLSCLYRVLRKCAENSGSDLVLIDVGPNLGALNRVAIIASDYVITPLAPDRYSLQGLANLGPTLRKWRKAWRKYMEENPLPTLELPKGGMDPIGYIVMQHSERAGRPTKSYHKWIDRIPEVFHKEVLEGAAVGLTIDDDEYCIAQIKHYRSLMPMAMEARKPIFSLTAADGAFGSHAEAVENCRKAFSRLVALLEERLGLSNGED